MEQQKAIEKWVEGANDWYDAHFQPDKTDVFDDYEEFAKACYDEGITLEALKSVTLIQYSKKFQKM